jgi:hypothetical protein
LTLTCPVRQAPDAAERDLASRTDQIQLSTRPVWSPAIQQTVMRYALASRVQLGAFLEGPGGQQMGMRSWELALTALIVVILAGMEITGL